MKNTDINAALIVDDSRLSRTAAKIALQKCLPHCLIVDEAANADEALARVDNEHYDLILLDINMPGMDGLTLVPLLKEKTPNSQIVLLTANVQNSTRNKAIELGVGFVNKPINKDTISDIFKQIGVIDVGTH